MSEQVLERSAKDRTLDNIPWIISVDDHVTEPPDLWTARLPAKFQDRAPRVHRDRVLIPADAREMSGNVKLGDPEGRVADYWTYDNKPMRSGLLIPASHAVGFEDKKLGNIPMTYDEVHRGAWDRSVRLADMTSNHVEASLCFSNVVTGYAGQLFLHEADKEFGMACLQAYNDWMLDDFCAGEGKGRLIPLTLVPLWDADLAAAEVRRCAAKGGVAVSFVESPHELGLPSIYSGYWEPFFAACNEARMNVSMHIGSSGKIPRTSADSPYMITSVLMFVESMTSALDYLLAGVFERFPNLKISYSEGQIGWLPYAIRRADKVWAAKDKEGGKYTRTKNPPSSYVEGHVYGCIFDDDTALLCRDLIGMGQIMMEVDYPHSACSFPNVVEVATGLAEVAGLSDDERYRFFRGNAIDAYGLERIGITK